MKSLAVNLHPPLEDGCDTCHEGGHDELMEGGGTELCLFCHDDPAEGHSVPHDALELGSCTECHNPHASAQQGLVKTPGAGPCGDCHDEQVAGPDEAQHGVIDLLGCRACHEPHGGEGEKLLRASGPELCLSCHGGGIQRTPGDDERVLLLDHFEVSAAALAGLRILNLSVDDQKGHPVPDHRVLGTPTPEELKRVDTTHKGPLTCLTCHDPHKGQSSQLFRWQASSVMEACQACHPK